MYWLEDFKVSARPSPSLSALCRSYPSLQLLVKHCVCTSRCLHSCILACCHDDHELTLETVTKPQLNVFILKVTLVMVSLHSKGK